VCPRTSRRYKCRDRRERRLLYVAMTRAKDDLHLVVPQRFFAHGQHSKGDRHMYASRTRFIPEALLLNLEKITRPAVSAARSSTAAQAAQMDIKAHMRRMCTETWPETRLLSPYRRCGTGMSVLLSTADIPRPTCDVRFVPIVLKNSPVETEGVR